MDYGCKNYGFLVIRVLQPRFEGDKNAQPFRGLA